ncbi:unnamed protein product [Gongylonema pulchrum]|uniref:BMERB domain-containing protein n=1 Tax=Gongylonema pulchrum TaxID=637853 RepID=A0A183D1I0_9BILA|nr:unnamed protein product [Gongylonema pulchrum]
MLQDVDSEKMKELKAVREKLEQIKDEEQAGPGFSKEETEALEEWQREVARLEESRLRDLDGHMNDASGGMSDIETESQLIDRFAPADHISMDTDSAEMEHRGEDQAASPSKFVASADFQMVPEPEDIQTRLVASIQVQMPKFLFPYFFPFMRFCWAAL